MEVRLVSRSSHVDEADPDAAGAVDWRYEYDLLTLLVSNGLEATVRVYADSPRQASLLRFAVAGQPVGVGDVKKAHMGSVAACAAYLREAGFTSVRWLGGDSYVEVPG